MTRPGALMTGATGAIGRAIARQLVGEGFEVVLAARHEGRGLALARQLGPTARVELVDLSEPASIAALGQRWQGPLHVLMNDAAVAPRRRTEGPDGVELQLSVNVLAYLRLAAALRPALAATEVARVVNVASYWAGDLDVDDLEFVRRPYDNDQAYRQSKQANRMLTVLQAEELAADGITVNVCHPGDVPSRLASDLGFGGHQSGDEAADTPVWLATDAGLAGDTGGYYRNRRREACRFAGDRVAVEQLWERCAAHRL